MGNIQDIPFDISDFHGRENSSVVAFFGRLSPLSNFHNTALNIEGTSYCCVEQYYQRERSLAAQYEKTAIQIMITKDPIQMKILGESVKILPADNWEPNLTMKTALEAKFVQDLNLRNFLLKTGDRKIVEASMNYKRGCGQTLKSPNILNPTTWVGDNMMGKLLEEIRDEIMFINTPL